MSKTLRDQRGQVIFGKRARAELERQGWRQDRKTLGWSHKHDCTVQHTLYQAWQQHQREQENIHE